MSNNKVIQDMLLIENKKDQEIERLKKKINEKR